MQKLLFHKTFQVKENAKTSLMNMNITVNQPAQPSQPVPRLQAAPFASSSPPTIECIENSQKIIAFTIYLPTKIDASRFSGPEQIFAGAPYISVQKSNLIFRPESIDADASIDRGARKRSKKS